jgi:hypothetical protein
MKKENNVVEFPSQNNDDQRDKIECQADEIAEQTAAIANLIFGEED